MDTEKILSRLSPVGIAVLAVGLVCGYMAPKIAHRFFEKKEAQASAVLRYAGVALAILGALILVDVLPI